MSDHIDDERTTEESFLPVTLRRPDQLLLVMVRGPDVGRCYGVPPEGGVIGRHADATIHINDPAVSRRHAAIEVDKDHEFVIRDLSSRNGVYLQGRAVQRGRLRDGDQVQLSTTTVLRVRLRGFAEAALVDELQRAATTDALTGVANRRYLASRLRQELSFAWRHQVPLSILMIDLDQFKTINDTHGHQLGDAVLRAVTEMLARQVRAEDVVARYGGDEFVILSRACPPPLGVRFAERLCQVARDSHLEVEGQQLTVTLSIGVAGCAGGQFDGHRLEPAELLARADTALYEAKRRGRDSVAHWPAARPRAPDPYSWLRPATDAVPTQDSSTVQDSAALGRAGVRR